MLPEIIHKQPADKQRRFKDIPVGGFFSTYQGGLFSKTSESIAFTWEQPPMNPAEDLISLKPETFVFTVQTKIEVIL